jgi:hypothetical protein
VNADAVALVDRCLNPGCWMSLRTDPAAVGIVTEN